MKKNITLVNRVLTAFAAALLMCTAAPTGALAKPITPQQARQRASAFLQQQGRGSQRLTAVDASVSGAKRTWDYQASGQRPAKAATNGQQTAEAQPYFVFDRGLGEGFVIVSGDDAVAEPILGYCERGTFDFDQLPPNMQEWLGDYARQIATLSTSQQAAAIHRIPTHPKVSQLMTSEWSQGSPYNDECPMYFNLGRSVTGCVATAYAQILYYHREKMVTETQAAMPAYNTWTSHPTYGQLHVDGIPAGAPLDWANMVDTYGSSRTAAQKLAVAQLMHYCGVAVHMDYTNGASGAQSGEVDDALRNYFGFGSSVRYVSNASSDEEWDAIIYAEIAEGRPIYISGANSEAGHAFVCDGYDGNRLYHINWGWGGLSDGYYYLSNLTPGQQGIGGSGDGYNGYREIIIGIEPENYQEKTMSFADATARQLCTQAWDQNGDGHLSYGEAAAVTSIGTVLKGSNIKTFTELHYFTSLSDLSDEAFEGCQQLTTVQLPKQLKHIGARAFKGCNELVALTLPTNISTIGEEAFSGCSALDAIGLPLSLRSLPARIFQGCTNLKELTLHPGLTALGDGAAEGCSALTDVYVKTMSPENISMGEGVFAGASTDRAYLHIMQGTRSHFSGHQQWQQFANIKEERDLSRGNFADFAENETFYLYHVGSGRYLTKGEAWGTQAVVGSNHPMRFTLRRSASMPEGTYYLYSNDTERDGHYLFRTWTDGNVGNGVAAAFVDGGSLTQTAHWALTDLGNKTYTLSIPQGYTHYDANCRWGVQTDHQSNVAQPTWGVYSDVVYEGHELDCQWRFVKYDADLAANYQAALTLENLIDVAQARGQKTQREQAVLDNLESTTDELLQAQRTLRKKLRMVDFADEAVGQICRSNFDLDADGELSQEEASMITDLSLLFYNTGITSFDELQLFRRLPQLYGNTFENCRQLKSVVLPESIERIYYRAFMNCSKLESINLPEYLILLGDNAFDGCTSLRTVSMGAPDPSAISTGDNIFRGVDLSKATLQVPVGSKALYEQAPIWKDFGTIVEVRGRTMPRFSPIAADAEGYIYNVAMRKYLTKGEAWGTQAIVGRTGMRYVWKRSATMPEGQYYLYSDETGATNKILYRTDEDSKVGTGVKACYVDGTLSARAYWKVEPATEELTYTLQVPQNDASYVEGQYLGTQFDHRSDFSTPTNGIYYDVERKNYERECLWAFVTTADMKAAQAIDQTASELKQLLATAKERDIECTEEQAVYDNTASTQQELADAIVSLREKLHYITFDDNNAKTVCLAAWDDDEDGELTFEEAAAVTELTTEFYQQPRVTSLAVLQYFTSLTTIPDNAFRNMLGLTTVYLPRQVKQLGRYAFNGCSELKYVVLMNDSELIPYGECSLGRNVTVFAPESVVSAYQDDESWNTRTISTYTGVPTVIALPASRIYGRTTAALKWQVDGAPISGEPVLWCDELNVGTMPVGDYVIHIEPGTITTRGLVCQNGVFTITPAPLTITANSYTRRQGEENPAFEVTYKGWRNRETAEVLTQQPVVSCEATKDSPAGTYDIVVSGAEAQNYEITFVNGVLTVVGSDGISTVSDSQGDEPLYDMQGRRIGQPTKKGIYITRQKRKVLRR